MSDFVFLLIFGVSSILIFVALTKTNTTLHSLFIALLGGFIISFIVWELYSVVTLGRFGLPAFISKIDFLKIIERLRIS